MREGCATRPSAMKLMLLFFRQLPIVCFLLAVTSMRAGALPSGAWSAQWEPVKLVNGSPVLFRVTAPKQVTALTGNFLGQDLSFRASQSCHCWYAFAGVSLNTKPGRYTLRVEGVEPGEKKAGMSYAVAVAAAHYPSSTLQVAPGFVEPPKEELARIEE